MSLSSLRAYALLMAIMPFPFDTGARQSLALGCPHESMNASCNPAEQSSAPRKLCPWQSCCQWRCSERSEGGV